MGNLLGCTKTKSKTKSDTHPYLPLSPELCTDQNEIVHDYVVHQIRPFEPTIRIPRVNLEHSEPRRISAVLPCVRSKSISPISKRASLPFPDIIPPKADSLFTEYNAKMVGTICATSAGSLLKATPTKTSATCIISAAEDLNNVAERKSVGDLIANSTSTIHASSPSFIKIEPSLAPNYEPHTVLDICASLTLSAMQPINCNSQRKSLYNLTRSRASTIYSSSYHNNIDKVVLAIDEQQIQPTNEVTSAHVDAVLVPDEPQVQATNDLTSTCTISTKYPAYHNNIDNVILAIDEHQVQPTNDVIPAHVDAVLVPDEPQVQATNDLTSTCTISTKYPSSYYNNIDKAMLAMDEHQVQPTNDVIPAHVEAVLVPDEPQVQPTNDLTSTCTISTKYPAYHNNIDNVILAIDEHQLQPTNDVTPAHVEAVLVPDEPQVQATNDLTSTCTISTKYPSSYYNNIDKAMLAMDEHQVQPTNDVIPAHVEAVLVPDEPQVQPTNDLTSTCTISTKYPSYHNNIDNVILAIDEHQVQSTNDVTPAYIEAVLVPDEPQVQPINGLTSTCTISTKYPSSYYNKIDKAMLAIDEHQVQPTNDVIPADVEAVLVPDEPQVQPTNDLTSTCTISTKYKSYHNNIDNAILAIDEHQVQSTNDVTPAHVEAVLVLDEPQVQATNDLISTCTITTKYPSSYYNNIDKAMLAIDEHQVQPTNDVTPAHVEAVLVPDEPQVQATNDLTSTCTISTKYPSYHNNIDNVILAIDEHQVQSTNDVTPAYLEAVLVPDEPQVQPINGLTSTCTISTKYPSSYYNKIDNSMLAIDEHKVQSTNDVTPGHVKAVLVPDEPQVQATNDQTSEYTKYPSKSNNNLEDVRLKFSPSGISFRKSMDDLISCSTAAPCPTEAALQAQTILNCSPMVQPRHLTRGLSSVLVNSISESYDDSDNCSTISGAYSDSPKNTFGKRNANARKKNQRKQTLKLYEPKPETKLFFDSHFKNVDIGKSIILVMNELSSNSNQLSEENYLAALLMFADIEDLQCVKDMRIYNRTSEKITRSDKPRTFVINVPNLIDSRPSVSVRTRISIHTNKAGYFKPPSGIISAIEPTFIEAKFSDRINTDILYAVKFICNRTTFQMEKLAIELMKEKKLVQFMFPKIKDNGYSSSVAHTDQIFTWFNKTVADNPEQKIVIKHIYHGTSYPYPYIVFGPPGTGKTTTLVETILQLWKNKRNSYILVVATSNFACNVISKRLLQFLPATEIFRLFAKSYEPLINKLDIDVLAASNFKGNVHRSTESFQLLTYRIVVTTPCSAGRLILEKFNTKHFTHLFIDECASCTEGTSLIPIAGLISTYGKINANIILAGDPLQLRPVIFSKYAEQFGYGVSMIERLMNIPLYQMNELSGEYNNNFITKLRVNYRSHKDILHISNKLFYNNELRPMASKDITDWVINWPHLPNPNFPILFQVVFGASMSENGSPSLYNQREIDVIMYYVELLVNKEINGKMVYESDIGVISPYRQQNKKIRNACHNRQWGGIEVATVEAFQGSEKSVIILSTVRGNVDTIGFLSNERRLNVALTRAKGFLIIIGDPKVLIMDKSWYEVLKFCYDNNAIRGEEFDFYSCGAIHDENPLL